MNSEPVIALEGVHKDYPSWAGRGRTLRGVFSGEGLRKRARRPALRGITLTVEPGEMVGLIGGNGAGKSTTLRVAAGLSRPTSGVATLSPNSAAVLTLGETFALELSGRENAVTSAVVAGFTPAEARKRVAQIIAFAELEDAAEEPVRTFSEGMKLRLAFGVVTQLRPQALILDEVMSVGDLSFQRKSHDWVRAARDRGTGILVASHDLDQLASDADRLFWLDHGQVRHEGEPAEVIAHYRHSILEETYRRTGTTEDESSERMGTQEATIEDVVLQTRGGEARERASITTGDSLTVRFNLRAAAPLPMAPIVAIVIRDLEGNTCCSITTERSKVPLSAAGNQEVSLAFERLDLVPGSYEVEIGAYREDWTYVYDLHVAGYPLQVDGPSAPDGLLLPPHRWDVQ